MQEQDKPMQPIPEVAYATVKFLQEEWQRQRAADRDEGRYDELVR